MANFEISFNKTLIAEGGYQNSNLVGDPGGQTYAGIARNYHPNWKGWELIDHGEKNSSILAPLVFDFFKTNFWDKIGGDEIMNQEAADEIYDAAVNMGVKATLKLLQISLYLDPETTYKSGELIKSLNSENAYLLIPRFKIARIARYMEICKKNLHLRKFLYSWISRTLNQ